MGERRADYLFRDQIAQQPARFDPAERPGQMSLGAVLAQLIEVARARAAGKPPLPPGSLVDPRKERKP
jgi:hypothetical protein